MCVCDFVHDLFLNSVCKTRYIANVVQTICSKGNLTSKDAQRIFPHFMWLLRDVILEPTDRNGKPCHISDYIKQKVKQCYDL